MGGVLAPAPEAVEQNLLVEAEGTGSRSDALDKDIRFGETYEYRAQRVARVKVDGETLELDGPLSASRCGLRCGMCFLRLCRRGWRRWRLTRAKAAASRRST